MRRMWVRDVSGVELDDFLLGLFRHAEAVFRVHVAKQDFNDLSMPLSVQYEVCDSKKRGQGNSLIVSLQ